MTKKDTRYRKIEVKMWGDEKFCSLSPIPPCGQGLWIYLLTTPDSSQIPGIFRSSEAGLADYLNWPLIDFRIVYQEVYAIGLVKADWEAKVVYIPNAIYYNLPLSPKQVIGWSSAWNLIPECDLKLEAYEQLKSAIGAIGKSFAEAFSKSIGKPIIKTMRKTIGKSIAKTMRYQEQEQEQEQEQDKKHMRSKSNVMDDFSKFYDRYPRKISPATAERAWKNKRLAQHADAIMEDLAQREAQDPNWNRHYSGVPYPATYLNGARWRDDCKILPDFVQKVAKETADERMQRNIKNMLGEGENHENNKNLVS